MEQVTRYRKIVRDVLMPLTERQYSGLNVTNDIVPAFHPEDVRPHTGYAVA